MILFDDIATIMHVADRTHCLSRSRRLGKDLLITACRSVCAECCRSPTKLDVWSGLATLWVETRRSREKFPRKARTRGDTNRKGHEASNSFGHMIVQSPFDRSFVPVPWHHITHACIALPVIFRKMQLQLFHRDHFCLIHSINSSAAAPRSVDVAIFFFNRYTLRRGVFLSFFQSELCVHRRATVRQQARPSRNGLLVAVSCFGIEFRREEVPCFTTQKRCRD